MSSGLYNIDLKHSIILLIELIGNNILCISIFNIRNISEYLTPNIK